MAHQSLEDTKPVQAPAFAAGGAQKSSQKEGQTTAWDLPTRLFKWTLVALVIDAVVSDKIGGAYPFWHKWNGYCVLTLLVFRVLWGFFGSSTALFWNFAPTPRPLLAYARAFAQGKTLPYRGHNPLGALMIFALFGLLFAQAITGLFSADEDMLIIIGPLANSIPRAMVDTMRAWHGFIFDVIFYCALLHIAVNLAYQFFKNEPLITAMVTGQKPARDFLDVTRFEEAPLSRALLCLLAASALVAGSITLAASLFHGG